MHLLWGVIDGLLTGIVFEIKAPVFEGKKNAYFLNLCNVKLHKNGRLISTKGSHSSRSYRFRSE